MFSRIATSAVAAGLVMAAPSLALADRDWQDDRPPEAAAADFDYARVTHVEPRYRQVRISVPRRECYSETTYLPDERRGYGPERPAAGGMILGGLIGAVIGHQIGSGDRGVPTVAGAVIGSAIGHDAAQRGAGRYADRYGTDYGAGAGRPVNTERCETRYSESTEQRVDGYRVSYRYNDREYQTELPYDPGERLRVRVTVTPDGY
jgi:uncharacterized protein YcfJ